MRRRACLVWDDVFQFRDIWRVRLSPDGLAKVKPLKVHLKRDAVPHRQKQDRMHPSTWISWRTRSICSRKWVTFAETRIADWDHRFRLCQNLNCRRVHDGGYKVSQLSLACDSRVLTHPWSYSSTPETRISICHLGCIQGVLAIPTSRWL